MVDLADALVAPLSCGAFKIAPSGAKMILLYVVIYYITVSVFDASVTVVKHTRHDIFVDNVDMIISIWPRMLMPEADHMA